MANYQLRASRVLAVQFTGDSSVPDGVEALEGGGFVVRGERIAFGDYVIDGKTVLGKAEFERLYEAVPDAPPAPAREAKASHK